MRRRLLLHRTGTLLAAVALLVAPLRATVACDMVGADGHPSAGAERPSADTRDSDLSVDHAGHLGHVGHAMSGDMEMAPEGLDGEATAPQAPASPAPDGAMPVPCDDLATCAVVGLPPMVVARGVLVAAPVAPRVWIADAPMAPVTAVEPPPPRG